MDQAPQKTDQTPAGESKDVLVTMDRLIQATNQLTDIQKKIYKQNKIGPVMIRSIAYALGSTLGLALVISILFYILKSIGVLDSLSGVFGDLKDLKDLYTN
ncbi:MAG: hypothetical protein Q7S37_04860 [bacterium]|nr:hypothetical protein [bacterium]